MLHEAGQLCVWGGGGGGGLWRHASMLNEAITSAGKVVNTTNLKRGSIGSSRSDVPSIVLAICWCPGEPLLADDGRILQMINAIGQPLRAFWEEGDEGIASP